MGVPPQIALGSGEEYEYGTLAVEFPPLEDWNEPFWRGVRELLATEARRTSDAGRFFASAWIGRGTGARIEALCGVAEPQNGVDGLEGRFREENRPDASSGNGNEAVRGMVRVDARQVLAGAENRPGSAGTFKLPPEFARKAGGTNVWNQNLRASGRSGVELDGFAQTFDVWNFVRFGNRKPSDPNNPTTLSGWRKLEADFFAVDRARR
ncbi:MAG: hypothetical protein IKY61_08730, partial [Thermoguttaceae bacterium]|nr:hypothetical protein [Thermoguttaceae bacterium]